MSSPRKTWSQAGRLLRTVQYLRPVQVTNRLARRLTTKARLDGPTPGLRTPSASWQSCEGRHSSFVSAKRFNFMAQEADIGHCGIWNDTSLPKLWLYHLHYFDDLLVVGAEQQVETHRCFMERWIEENPPIAGNGWEPYPLSRRIVNWIGWALSGHPLSEHMLVSLAQQVRALGSQLEYHLLGNHLFANAKALVFAGAFFEGREAEGWLDQGLAILGREIPEQLLGDGGHFELSPMYHAVILEDMIDLLQLTAIFPGVLTKAAIGQHWAGWTASMLDWLEVMSHPDQNVSFFNDSTFCQARAPAALSAYAARFGVHGRQEQPRFCHLADSGYVRFAAGPWCVLFDIAEVGAAYIPGHAHADTLSVEISMNGTRLVTNSGTSTYETGVIREGERGTASHATVEVEGMNSSEMWASFRVGRRARPFDISTSETAAGLNAAASHDGYRFLSGKPVHRRSVTVDESSIKIRDDVRGSAAHRLAGRFPLHPSIASARIDGRGWIVEDASGRIVRIVTDGPVDCGIERGYFAPGFGIRQERAVLVWRAAVDLPMTVTTEFLV